ncbi:MAG: ChrB protein [Anaerolineae bacterium]|nr:ChrB protein [Anaerolineae bacterium]MCI0609348.1 ChrB protein [Anaerolineae bacterium]
MTNWLLLHYKLPTKPSALRVYVWRKLKRLGAILLHDAVWILPDQPRTAEQVQWLTAEIQEMGGEAYSWRASTILGADNESITKQFNEQVDVVYSDLLKRLEKPRADLQEISKLYQQAASQDFFHSELGLHVREKLTSRRGEKI